jgi:hypothetical protein
MNNKNKLILIAVLSLVFALVVAAIHSAGVPFKDMLVGIVALALYVVLIIAYLLRFAMLFLGVFAAFKLFQEWHNKRLAV